MNSTTTNRRTVVRTSLATAVVAATLVGSTGVGVASAAGTAAPAALRLGCYDGSCTVTAKPGDRFKIASRFGFSRLVVKSVRAGIADLAVSSSADGISIRGLHARALSSCSTSGGCFTSGSVSVTPQRPAHVNSVKIKLVRTSGGRAVLVLSH